jgi:hypothetical protein
MKYIQGSAYPIFLNLIFRSHFLKSKPKELCKRYKLSLKYNYFYPKDSEKRRHTLTQTKNRTSSTPRNLFVPNTSKKEKNSWNETQSHGRSFPSPSLQKLRSHCSLVSANANRKNLYSVKKKKIKRDANLPMHIKREKRIIKYSRENYWVLKV